MVPPHKDTDSLPGDAQDDASSRCHDPAVTYSTGKDRLYGPILPSFLACGVLRTPSLIMGFKLPSLFAPSKPVIVDGSSVLASIYRITQTTIDFDKTVASWDGGMLGALSILVKASNLINDTNAGAATAEAAGILNMSEAEEICVASQDFANLVGRAIDTAIVAKPKFQNIPLVGNPAVVAFLHKLRNAEFSKAICAKMPADMHAVSNSIVKQIEHHLDRGISAFESDGGGPKDTEGA